MRVANRSLFSMLSHRFSTSYGCNQRTTSPFFRGSSIVRSQQRNTATTAESTPQATTEQPKIIPIKPREIDKRTIFRSDGQHMFKLPPDPTRGVRKPNYSLFKGDKPKSGKPTRVTLDPFQARQLTPNKRHNINHIKVRLNRQLSMLVDNKEYNRAENWFNHTAWRHRNLETYNIMIKCFGLQGRLLDVVRTYGTAVRQNLKPNVITFTSIIGAFARSNKLKEALHWLEKMKEERVTPNYLTYRAVMKPVLASEDTDLIISMYEEMPKYKIKPIETAYSSLIDIFHKKGDVANMEKWFNVMLQNGIQPTDESYGAMIISYANLGRQQEMEKYYGMMRDANCKSNTLITHSLITFYMDKDQHEKAWGTYEQMKKDQIPPLPRTFSILFQLAVKEKNPNKIDSLIKEMTEEHNIDPTPAFYAEMVRAYIDCGAVWKAVKLFDTFDASLWTPKTCSTILTAVKSPKAKLAYPTELDSEIKKWEEHPKKYNPLTEEEIIDFQTTLQQIVPK